MRRVVTGDRYSHDKDGWGLEKIMGMGTMETKQFTVPFFTAYHADATKDSKNGSVREWGGELRTRVESEIEVTAEGGRRKG